jgi:hypothetical protein
MMAIDLFPSPGDETTAFVRRGIRVIISATRGADARAAVDGMRKAHYQDILDGLGVETWDSFDEDAVHFIGVADGLPVASIRTSRDSVGSGETASVFPDLSSVLPDDTAEYLYLSRQLVVPEFRRIGLSAVITHVAAAWWLSRSPLAYALASSREPTVGNARVMGGTVLAGPSYFGPEKVPLVLVGARLPVLAERTKALLDQNNWIAGDRDPVVDRRGS